MPARPLALARRAHATAFLGLVEWLQYAPELRRLNPAWQAWTGDVEDPEPAATDRLQIKLTPELAKALPEATDGSTRIWSRPLDVVVEATIPGTSAAAALDLADALDARLDPRDDATLAALEAKLDAWGVMEIDELQPPTIAVDPSATTVLTGRYRLEMWT